jgi:hypothetical protein
MYNIGTITSAEMAMRLIKEELENTGLGTKKTLFNISLISNEYRDLQKDGAIQPKATQPKER